MSKLVSPKMPWDYQRKWHWEICRCWLVPLVSGEGLWSSGLLLTTQNSLTPSRLVSISFSSPNPTWKPNENISSRHTTHGNDCISKHHKMSTYSLQCQYPAKLRECWVKLPLGGNPRLPRDRPISTASKIRGSPTNHNQSILVHTHSFYRNLTTLQNTNIWN